MIDRFLQRFQSLQKLHVELISDIVASKSTLQSGSVSLEDGVDLCLLLREMSAVADEYRKEADAFKKVVERSICLMWLTINMQNPEESRAIKGRFASGLPDSKNRVSIPNKRTDPTNWQLLLAYFGIPQELIDSKIVDLHWPSLQEAISKLEAEGKPLPPGINTSKTWVDYFVKLTKHKGLQLSLVQPMTRQDDSDIVMED